MNIFNISVEGRTPGGRAGGGGRFMDGVKEDRKSVDVRESQCVYHLPKGKRNGAGMRAKTHAC